MEEANPSPGWDKDFPTVRPKRRKIAANSSLYSHNIPENELYVMTNGRLYTRWCRYTSDIVGNEHISYLSSYKFLFRPYYAIFSTVNLSNEEQESTFTLTTNFILSALVSNIPLLIILSYLFYTRKAKSKNTIVT